MGFGLRVQSLRAVGLRLKAMSVMVHSTWGATLPPNLSGTVQVHHRRNGARKLPNLTPQPETFNPPQTES